MNSMFDENARPSGFSRRTALRGAAWSVPVVAVAVASPAAAASNTPADPCVAAQGSWALPTGVTLFHDGANGKPAGTALNGGEPYVDKNGGPVYTTGWTPVDPVEEHATADNPPKPGYATKLWGNLAVDSAAGFLSMDDRDNKGDPSNLEPVAFPVTYALDVTAGEQYDLALAVNTGAEGNGLQYLDITVDGAGVSTTVARGKVGAEWSSEKKSDDADYDVLQATQTFPVSFIARETGQVTITYTFTLAAVTGGSQQNADIWVATPVQQNCTP